jgi:hypothetical protein
MTEAQLTKGEELRQDITLLERALLDVQTKHFFGISQGCSPMGRRVDPFLSILNVELETYAVKAITDKIKELDSEFKSL